MAGSAAAASGARPTPWSVHVEAAQLVTEGDVGTLRHYAYPLLVSPATKLVQPWRVAKSYDELATLHEHLKSRFPQEPVPVFPRKRHLSQLLLYDTEEAYLEAIRGELQQFFDVLMGIHSLREDVEVRLFLEVDSRSTGRSATMPAPARLRPESLEQVSSSSMSSRDKQIQVFERSFSQGVGTYGIRLKVRGVCWTLTKSHLELEGFSDSLARLPCWSRARSTVPGFPKRRRFSLMVTQKAQDEYRSALQEELEAYVTALLSHPELEEELVVRSFFEVDEHRHKGLELNHVRDQVSTNCGRFCERLRSWLRVPPQRGQLTSLAAPLR